jgi:hypothetical protein
MTRRIRALDHRRDSAEFAEGRLRDYVARIRELVRLRDESPEQIATLRGAIEVSLRLIQLKFEQFNLPVVHGDENPLDGMQDGGASIPSPVHSGPLSRTGSGGRLFTESDEYNDW